MTDYSNVTSKVMRLLYRKGPATPPTTRSKRSKDDSGSSQTETPSPVPSVNDDSNNNEQPKDGDSTRSGEPTPFSVEHITLIVSAIVESKLASMSPASTPTSQANAAKINPGILTRFSGC